MNPKLLCPLLLVTALAACQSTDVYPRRPQTHGEAGALVRLPGGNVTVGFAEGRLTGAAKLGAFSISKTPVTVQGFKSCVAAGACSWSDASCVNPQGADDDVALCVGFESAAAYCGWVGARLPTLAEWLAAARGPTVRRFPWGDSAPTCDEHPGAKAPLGQVASREDAAFRREHGYCGAGPDGLLQTAQHPGGASPAGIEDILLSAGELVHGSSDSVISVCLSERSGCVVFGLSPGAIDAVEGVAQRGKTTAAPGATVSHAYGFRCVQPEEVL